METITIRGVAPEITEKLKLAALQQNKSINQIVLELIKENLGLKKEKQYSREYTDLDHLFGSWSDDEFKKINAKINQERQIDQELWK
jgi:hypothetical protein